MASWTPHRRGTGRAQDRVNHGRLGPKGLYGWQGEQRDRLTAPLARENGRLVETDWDTAMSRVVDRFRCAGGFQQVLHRTPFDVMACRMLKYLARSIPVTAIKVPEFLLMGAQIPPHARLRALRARRYA